jgi:actin-related protein
LCNMIVRPDLYRNIVLTGGNTLIEGFTERFKKEIESLLPKSDTKVKVNVVAPPFRQISSWVGGSIYSLMPIFNELAITKEEYEEHGDNAWLTHDNVKKWEKYLYN